MRPMLASRVIEMLAAAIREHGDRPVRGVLDTECDDDTGYEVHVAKFVTGPEFVVWRAPWPGHPADNERRDALIDRLHELGDRPESTEVPARALDTYTIPELEAILRDEYGELPDGSDAPPRDVHASAEAALGDRSAAKAANFGALYGGDGRTFMERLAALGPAPEVEDAPDGWTDPANDEARLDDALRRLCEPILVEAAQEVRGCRHAHLLPEQAENHGGAPAGDEEVAAHLHDLYGDRVRSALMAEYGAESGGDMDRAEERFVSIAFSLAAVAESVVDAVERAGDAWQRAADEGRDAQARVDEPDGPPWRLIITEDELDAGVRLDYHDEIVRLIMDRDEANNGDMLEGDASLLYRVQARLLGDDGAVGLRVWLLDPEDRAPTDEVMEFSVLADTPLSGDAWACLRCDDHELVRVRRG